MRFKIWETYAVSGWNYVEAETKEEAEKFFESEDSMYRNFKEEEWEYQSTDWKSLREVNE